MKNDTPAEQKIESEKPTSSNKSQKRKSVQWTEEVETDSDSTREKQPIKQAKEVADI